MTYRVPTKPGGVARKIPHFTNGRILIADVLENIGLRYGNQTILHHLFNPKS